MSLSTTTLQPPAIMIPPSTHPQPATPSKLKDPAAHSTTRNPSTQPSPIRPNAHPSLSSSCSTALMNSQLQQSTAASSSASAPTASTPSGRWETLYVYAYLIKFLPPMVDNLYDAIGFEQALAAPSFNQIIFDVLCKFLRQLRPDLKEAITREDVTLHLKFNLELFCRGRERTVWWQDSLKANIPPYGDMEDFFDLPWHEKLVIFRQLVDWQLSGAPMRKVIDVAWELTYQRKKKKTNKTVASEFAPPDPDDPMSISKLKMVPIGQDAKRTRYWMIDNSPRVWSSGNPWRMYCPVTAVCSTMEEFHGLMQTIKDTMPEHVQGQRRNKYTTLQLELLTALETRLPFIEEEEKRVEADKAERLEQKEREEEERLLAMQGEEVKKLEISSRTRSKAKPADETDTMDIDLTESSHVEAPETHSVKGQKSNRKSVGKKNARKRKQVDAPASEPPSERDETTAPPPETKKAPAKALKGTGKPPYNERDIATSEPPPKTEDTVDDREKDAEPTQRLSRLRAKTESAEEAMELDEEDEFVPPPEAKLGRRRSTRSAVTQASSSVSRAHSSAADAESTGSSASRTRSTRAATSRAGGSRRSSRLALKPEADADYDNDDDDDGASTVTASLLPALSAATLGSDDTRPAKKPKLEEDAQSAAATTANASPAEPVTKFLSAEDSATSVVPSIVVEPPASEPIKRPRRSGRA